MKIWRDIGLRSCLGFCLFIGGLLALMIPTAWAGDVGMGEETSLPKGRTYVSFFTKVNNIIATAAQVLQGNGPHRINNHCHFDKLQKAWERDERRAWAYRSGYITKDQLKTLQEKHEYPAFFGSTSPTYEYADCGSYNVNSMIFCWDSCFSSDTSIWFDGNPFRLNDWLETAESPPQSITTLSEKATIEHLATSERAVKIIDQSEFEGALVEIELDTDQKIKVTPDHPMVDGKGNLVEARDLSPGDTLLTIRGSQTIASLRSIDFSGYVWNVEPESQTVKGNVVVANGIFSGGMDIWDAAEGIGGRLALRHQLWEKLKEKQMDAD